MDRWHSVSSQIATVPPENIALRQGETVLTYGELNARADRLAAHMVSRGLQPEATVAICLERSFDWVTSALAIMRAGAAYIPMDPAWPDDRLKFLLHDAGAWCLIAGEALQSRLAVKAFGIDPLRDAEAIRSAGSSGVHVTSPSDLAYVIYTSGSTGLPKGVEVTNANLLHLISWHHRAFEVTSEDRASHVAGLSFDAAGWEIWPYLVAGASVAWPEEIVRTSPELLQQWLLAERITIGFVPTALASLMMEMVWPTHSSLRVLLTGGDTLRKAPQEGLPFALVNNYGPTECTVVATSGVVIPASGTTPSIGRAIDATNIYLLDEHGQPVPDGTVGEICIGGGSVARGYRNRPELTALSFVPDAFAERPGARLYRSGDCGLRLPDGQIAFRGRLDGQEKIRGQRLELEEVSSMLDQHSKVAFSVVIAVAAVCEAKTLVAYVLPAKGTKPTSTELQDYLAEKLPSFMIPPVFVQLSALPLSLNGKIDRSALDPPHSDNLLPGVAGRTLLSPLEETLLAMAHELLGTQEVSVEDDFFLVGGHSLLGTQFVLRIRAAFGIGLNLRDLFAAGTVERLAATVEELLIKEVDALTEEEALAQMEVSS